MPVETLEPRRLLTSGLFLDPVVYGDQNVMAVTSGDFNGDGRPDVAGVGSASLYPSPSPSWLYVLLNDGTGHFTPTTTPLPNGNPRRIAAADLDGDGREDLAVLDAPNLRAYLSDGAGGVTPIELTLPAQLSPSVPATLWSGDFDNDGRRELLVNNTVLFGNVRAFTPVSAVVGSVMNPIPADVNGDGWLDLVNGDNARLNDGTGHFPTSPPPPPLNRTPFGGGQDLAASGDFNGDGRADQAFTSVNDDSTTLFLNRGDGTFDFRNSLDILSYPGDVAVGDIDGDDRDDLVLLEFDGSLYSLLSRDNGAFRPGGQEDVPSPRDAVMADLNGDGRDDLVTGSANFAQGVRVLLAGGQRAPAVAQFGAVNGAARPSVTVPGAGPNNTRPQVTFTLRGPGTGTVYDTGANSGLKLVLDGTTDASSVAITVPKGDRYQVMAGVTVNGSLRAFTALNTFYFGDFTVGGTLGAARIAGAAGGSTMVIRGAGVPTTFIILGVEDLTLTTQSPIKGLVTGFWQDKDFVRDSITAPSIGKLGVIRISRSRSPDFGADVNVTGTDPRGTSLGLLMVQGGIYGSQIRTAGNIGTIRSTGALNMGVFAGVAPSVAGLPASAADFVTHATVKNLQIGSVPGGTHSGEGRFAAWSFGTVRIGQLQHFGPPAPHGLVATSVASYSRRLGLAPKSPFPRLGKWTHVTTPGVFDEDTVTGYSARIVS